MRSIANWIYIITSILLILITILLGFQFIRNDCRFSTDNIKDILGVIVSCVALIITAFFVVMAVNAYGHIKDIEEIEKDAKHTQMDINQKYDGVFKKAEMINKMIQLAQYRSIYVNPNIIDEDTKISYLYNIANLGDDSDVPQLERLLNTENDNIKQFINVVIEDIKERTRKESVRDNTTINSTFTKETKSPNFFKTIVGRFFRYLNRN